MTFTLKSGNPAYATVPASVTVPEGAKSATFPISTNAVAGIQPVGIAAKIGFDVFKPILKIFPPQIAGLSLAPNPVKGGVNATGTVMLSGPAPAGGFTVNVTSSAAEAVVPATVTVPAGATSVFFTITTSVVPAKVVSTISISRSLSPTKLKNLVINK
jgi:trimeric autotransporter adhesin